MGAATLIDHREEIRKADENVGKQQRRLEDVAKLLEEPDREVVERFVATAKGWATAFNHDIPNSLPPDAQNEIRNHLITGLETLEREDFEERVLDHLDNLLLRLEAVRHILRDACDEDIGSDLTSARELVRRLDEWLPTIDRASLGRLVKVDPRTIQRWLKDDGRATERLRLVAQLVALLHRAWTPQGVFAWFYRPRTELGGHAPAELLEDPEQHGRLLNIARQGRAGHGE